MKTERTEIELPASHVCAACPWLTANHGKRKPAYYYTKANRRRLWNGLRTGQAPGMTCHPTDPENQPVSEHVTTRECAGALQLIARELHYLNQAGDPRVYAKNRPVPLTRQGIMIIADRMIFGRWRNLYNTTIDVRDDVSHGFETRS